MSKNTDAFKKFISSVHGDGIFVMVMQDGDLVSVEPASFAVRMAVMGLSVSSPKPEPKPEPKPLMEQRYTALQVANALGVSRQTIYNWVKAGLLPAVRVGLKSWHVTQSQLDMFLRKGMPETGAGSRKGPPEGVQLPLPDEYLPAGSGKLAPIVKRPTKKKRRV